jgi:hypothetical protein
MKIQKLTRTEAKTYLSTIACLEYQSFLDNYIVSGDRRWTFHITEPYWWEKSFGCRVMIKRSDDYLRSGRPSFSEFSYETFQKFFESTSEEVRESFCYHLDMFS